MIFSPNSCPPLHFKNRGKEGGEGDCEGNFRDFFFFFFFLGDWLIKFNYNEAVTVWDYLFVRDGIFVYPFFFFFFQEKKKKRTRSPGPRPFLFFYAVLGTQ